jgi:predicted transporter
MLDTNNKIKLIDIDAFYSNRDDVNKVGTHLWSILCPTCLGVVHCDDYEILLLNVIDLAAGIDITKVKIENTKFNIYNARKKILDDILIGIKNKKKPNYLDQFIKSLITLIYKMRNPKENFQ